MQIGRLPAREPVPTDLPGALAARAGALGHRPAVTVHRSTRREEQGFAGLAQWAAKGAHLLELDLLLEPGDRVQVLGPPGWPPVAVAYAAWWAGLVVTDGPADVAVVHVSRVGDADADDVLVWGDAVDGAPDASQAAVAEEPWSVAVQAFPDQPPAPRGVADSPALTAGGRTLTGAALLEEAAALRDGTLGIDPGHADELGTWAVALAARPLATGSPTVLLTEGVPREATGGEAVRSWLS